MPPIYVKHHVENTYIHQADVIAVSALHTEMKDLTVESQEFMRQEMKKRTRTMLQASAQTAFNRGRQWERDAIAHDDPYYTTIKDEDKKGFRFWCVVIVLIGITCFIPEEVFQWMTR